MDVKPNGLENEQMTRPTFKSNARPLWAERLTALRVLTGKSQTDFAKSIGLSQQRYGQYENGKAEPNVSTWIAISDKIGQPVDFIMRGPPKETVYTVPKPPRVA